MRKLLTAAVMGLGLATAVPAQAGFDFSTQYVTVTDNGGGNYAFSQSGWLGGAQITGTFVGFDDDSDGYLDSYYDEITDFTLIFSGNSQASAFTFDFSNLWELVYELDGGPLGDDCGCSFENIAAFNDSFTLFYGANIGPFELCGESESCSLIASVPEPSNWALLIAGFGLVGATMRRHSSYRAV